MIELHLKDTEFPFQGFDNTRLVVRAIVLNEEGEMALHRIRRDDAFGDQEYYETPGGGVDGGETLTEALKRECLEELGEEVELLQEIGVVYDAYNLIKRQNESHYFLCKKLSQGDKHFVSDGDLLIQETLWVSVEEGAKLLQSQPDNGVSLLVKTRELPIVKEAEKVLKHWGF